MSSSAWECAPGPCVCGSSHHSEMEYPLCVSSPSALKMAQMRPIGYERPAPGGRKMPARFVELSGTHMFSPWSLFMPVRNRTRMARIERINTDLFQFLSALIPFIHVIVIRVLFTANISMHDRLLFEEFGESLLYFFRRYIFLAGCDEPDVAERIFQSAVAVAVETVLYRLQYFRSGVISLTDNRIRVFDVKMNFHWRSAERLRAAMAGFWILIGEHNHRASNSDLGVPDLSARFCQAVDLRRAKGFFVKLYGRGRAIDTQVWGRALTAVRNRVQFA